jgi:hypothetical protein
MDHHIRYPDRDGSFHFVALPCPGALVGRSFDFPCVPRPVDPAEEKAYPFAGKTPFLGGGLQGYSELFHSYRLFDARDTGKPLKLDIELDPGRALSGRLIGPDSKSVRGAVALGLTHDPVNENNWSYRNDPGYRARLESRDLPTEHFTALGLDPRSTRLLTFVHRGRKLIANVILGPNPKTPLVVRMEPWGVLAGRLVDARGKPLQGVDIELHYPPQAAAGLLAPGQPFHTDRDGRFRVEGLIPRLKHELSIAGGVTVAGLSAAAGEVKDLGEIPPKAAALHKSR